MISFCKIFYVSFIEFLVLLYFLYRYFMESDPNVPMSYLCVMRLKEGINLSKKCNGDMISILQGTSKEGTSDVPIRVLEIPLDDGTKEYLATNLFDPAVTKDMFRELYFYRWNIMQISA